MEINCKFLGHVSEKSCGAAKPQMLKQKYQAEVKIDGLIAVTVL